MSNRKQILFAICLLAHFPAFLWAQDDAFSLLQTGDQRPVSTINHKTLVRRNNPQTTHVGQRQFLLGDGNRNMAVDATAMQTFLSHQDWPVAIGLNLADTTRLTSLNMQHDLWNGKADSRFRYNGHYFHVETVCQSVGSLNPNFATRITSDSTIEVVFRPEPSAFPTAAPDLKLTSLKQHAVVTLRNATATHRLAISWRGKASIKKKGNQAILTCKAQKQKGQQQQEATLEIVFYYVGSMPSDNFFNDPPPPPFTDYALRTATSWNNFWTECSLADFSACNSPEARLVERRMVESLYNSIVSPSDDWWLQAPLTAWGFAKQIVTPLRRIYARTPDQLTQRPEFIAAALLTLRAYTLPQVVEHYQLKPSSVQLFRTTILNAFAQPVANAAQRLADGVTTAPDCLDSRELLAVAHRWQATVDSLNQPTTIAPAADNSTSPGADSSISSVSGSPSPANCPTGDAVSPAAGTLFRLPMVTDLVAHPVLTPQQQSLLLLAIAAHRWPDSWNVKTENILPIP